MKILVLAVHPHMETSVVNKAWAEELFDIFRKIRVIQIRIKEIRCVRKSEIHVHFLRNRNRAILKHIVKNVSDRRFLDTSLCKRNRRFRLSPALH